MNISPQKGWKPQYPTINETKFKKSKLVIKSTVLSSAALMILFAGSTFENPVKAQGNVSAYNGFEEDPQQEQTNLIDNSLQVADEDTAEKEVSSNDDTGASNEQNTKQEKADTGYSVLIERSSFATMGVVPYSYDYQIGE